MPQIFAGHAGKFKSQEALRIGFLNLAKLLGIDAEEAIQMVHEEGMEDAYIRLQAGMGKALGWQGGKSPKRIVGLFYQKFFLRS